MRNLPPVTWLSLASYGGLVYAAYEVGTHLFGFLGRALAHLSGGGF